jgi:uncharacterized protein
MEKTSETKSIPQLSQTQRIWVLAINIFITSILYFCASGSFFPSGSGASIWFLAAITYWLLTLVAAPFFLPPRDSLSTAISVCLLLAPIDFSLVTNFHNGLVYFDHIMILVSVLVGTAAVISIFKSDNNSPFKQISYRVSSILGKGEILLTPAVIISAAGFYQNNSEWTLIILCFWVFMIIIKPAELILRIVSYIKNFNVLSKNIESIGSIIRIDNPNLVRICLSKDISSWNSDTVHVASLSDGRKTYILPLFTQTQNDEVIATGLFCETDQNIDIPTTEVGIVYPVDDKTLATKLRSNLSGEESINKVVGIVVEKSSISDIKFQIVNNIPLEEGMVVFSLIRGEKVYYQILDANTNEENFHQNPYGVHIVSATQLGCYDPQKGFRKFPWLPDMNQPVFIASNKDVNTQTLENNEFFVGKIPNTPFGLPVILDDLVEYHTAILGVTGTGKTELALDIIKNALDRDTKVFCVDFTGEYKARLADKDPQSIGLNSTQTTDLENFLFGVEVGEFKASKEKIELKKFIDNTKPEVEKQIEAFLTDPDHQLGIFELPEITNTKATLRTTELYISAIMDWARKNRRAERIMIVLEEAHTIIPEVYGSGFDTDTQWVVSRIGQIALQGRKYGVGLLLVSQRTALVSKTVLSQCNTYFTHALVDKTSLDYLGGVYSSEHVKVIPNLRPFEFLAHGKAVKSERPILVKRDYDPAIAKASKALDAPKKSKKIKKTSSDKK